MSGFRHEYLADVRAQFAKLRSAAERAMAQIGDDDFLRSRCTDFLTADGEKPDRDRDGEFVLRR